MIVSRGTYRPLDHDRHYAIGYATDELVDYARDRAVGDAARRVLPIYDAARGAAHGARMIRAGAEVVGDRAAAEAPSTLYGMPVISALKAALFAGICLGGFFTMRSALRALRDTTS